MKFFSRIFWGALFISSAVLLILSNLNVISVGFETTLWLIFMTFLGAIALKSLWRLEWFGVFLPIAGIAQICNHLNYLPTELTTQLIWITASLLAVGFTLILPKKYLKGKKSCNKQNVEVSESSDNKVSSYTYFGATTKYINSKNLEEIVVDCSFGGAEIYLNEADLSKKGASLKLSVNFGGVKIFVPKTWIILDGIDSVMGGVDFEGRPAEPEAGKTLKISGTVQFSGVTIIYV